MEHKSLGLLELGQKSLGQSRDFELWDSNPRDKNRLDWKSRPMPIFVHNSDKIKTEIASIKQNIDLTSTLWTAKLSFVHPF